MPASQSLPGISEEYIEEETEEDKQSEIDGDEDDDAFEMSGFEM